jgi:hypothetical protein
LNPLLFTVNGTTKYFLKNNRLFLYSALPHTL